MNTTWEGRSGTIFRIPGAPDWYGVDYMVPVAGNWRWTHLPSKDFTFSAARVVWMDGVAVAVRADGSTFTPKPTSPVDPLPPPPVVIPPVIVIPPPVVPPPADTSVKTFRVVVVPLRYQPPASDPYLAYANSLPKVTQDALQRLFQPLPAWWSRETYGKQALDIEVLPAVEIQRVPASCDFFGIENDGITECRAAKVTADRVIIVTTYACWSSHMETGPGFTIAWGATQDSIGEYAHELGHQFGLMHTARHIPPEGYVLYGGGMDQMCGPSSLSHFRADHKTMLGVLTPQVVTAGTFTLRNIFDYPDALHVGQYTVEYVDDRVWVSLRESVPNGTYGGSDTTVVAYLAAGQSWNNVMHVGGGKVVVK